MKICSSSREQARDGYRFYKPRNKKLLNIDLRSKQFLQALPRILDDPFQYTLVIFQHHLLQRYCLPYAGARSESKYQH